jgi:hypothetical protein
VVNCRCGERVLEELGETRGKQKVSETRRKDVSELRFGSSRNQTQTAGAGAGASSALELSNLVSSAAVLIFAFSFFSL